MLAEALPPSAALLAADPGYRGPRMPCGQGHQAEFVSYREADEAITHVFPTSTARPGHLSEGRVKVRPGDDHSVPNG
jgi:hypothetical protein